jgi:hypothetical protein
MFTIEKIVQSNSFGISMVNIIKLIVLVFVGNWFFLLPMPAGIMVLVGTMMMNSRSQDKRTYGMVVLVSSIIGFTGRAFQYSVQSLE